jgi:MFS family permease
MIDSAAMHEERERRIFYGWWVVGACMVIYGFSALINYTYTIYAPFISKEMNWTRADLGNVYSLFLLSMLVAGVVTGWLIDRFGPRWIILIGSVIGAIGMALFSTVQSMREAYVYFAGITAVGLALQFLIPTQTLARRWFLRRAALATGLIMSVFGIVAAVFFPLLAHLATRHGWRPTILWSGIGIEVLVFLLALFVVRDKPETMGLNMDGMSDEEAKAVGAWGGGIREPHMTRGEALKTSQFWIITLGISFIAMVFVGFMGHITMVGISVGMDPAQAATVMTAFALPSVAGRLCGGWLADKVGKRRVLVIFGIMSGLLYVYAWAFATNATHLYAFAILFGLASSPVIVTIPPLLGDLYGRFHLASILGLFGIIQGGIAAIGPIIAGRMAEALGSYNLYYLLGALANAFFAAMVLRLEPTRVERELGGR